MGVFVQLFIEPSRIDPHAWAQYYDQVFAMLRAHPDGLLGPRQRATSRGTRYCYSRELEHDVDSPESRHLEVCGDMASLETGETFLLYRALDHYSRPPYRGCSRRAPSKVQPDIILAMLEESPEAVRVFGDKTQGRPFHVPMLAVAMLAESRFPRAAYVSGDIDRAQAERASAWAQKCLGHVLPLPVCVDGAALAKRLTPHLDPEHLSDAISTLYRGVEPGYVFKALLPVLGPENARAYLRKGLSSYTSAGQFGFIRLFIDWINAGGDLAALLEEACLHHDGPRFAPKEIMKTIASTWTTLEPGDAAFLAPLLRPEGEPGSQFTQLGGALLDMGMSGRHIRLHVSLSDAQQVVRECFPRNGGSLAKQLERETRKERQCLDRYRADVSAGLESQLAGIAATDPVKMRQCKRWEELSEAARAELLQFGTVVRDWLRGVLKDPKLVGSLELLEKRGLQATVVRALEGSHFVLTEDAWAWIEAEEDTEVLELLLALALLDYHELRFSELRRNVLESRSLCHLVTGALIDPTLVAETHRSIAETQ